MFVFAFYLLKVTIASAILFGYYWFVLRNKIFHQYNRFYLLASVMVSLLLPLITINIWHKADTTPPQAIKLLQIVTSSNEYLDEIVITAKPDSFTTEQLLTVVYIATCFIFLFIFVNALINIRLLFIRNQHSFFQNIFFVNTTAKGTPFSFLKYIFWNDNIDPDSPTGKQIFKHEIAHVRQKHSYDKLFVNAVLIFSWINPFFWLIRKELNMIHEFIADKIAVEDYDTESFAAMILQAAYPQHRFNLTNSFFYSPIKRRLMMLAKNRNPKVGYIGRLLVLPLAFLIFAAFTLKAKIFKTTSQIFAGKQITVVVDAGHGGSDHGAYGLSGKVSEKNLVLSITKKIKTLNTNTNINIVLTRESDIYQTPQEKADFAKSKNADLFISIHLDANAESNSGMSVWVAKDNFANTPGSKLLASALIGEFSNNYELSVVPLPQQRETGIRVLQDATCPAVLIEAGNIANNKDLEYVQSSVGIEAIATRVLAAFEKYAFAKNAGTKKPMPVSDVKAIAINKVDSVPEITLKNAEEALIIIDGKTISNKEFKNIDPASIQRIEVFKNKSDISKYGEKGNNGVIIVTTKIKTKVSENVNVTIRQDSIGNVKTSIRNSIENINPLYVLNGTVQPANFNINTISPNDIESIDVLKDKKGVDKYGEKAINGVIEIKTKFKNVKEKVIEITKKNSDIINDDKHDAPLQEPVFTMVETDPRFPGGDSAWKQYLMKNAKSETPLLDGWKSGVYKITVSFIVKKDGSLTDIKTADYPGSKTAEHCLNLIKQGPKWVPGIQNGHVVNSYRKQPITFVVEEQGKL